MTTTTNTAQHERLKARMSTLSSDRVRLLVTSALCAWKWSEMAGVFGLVIPRTWEEIIDFAIAASAASVTVDERREAIGFEL